MTWQKSNSRLDGFDGATSAVLIGQPCSLGLWDYDRCRAWQPYKFDLPGNQFRTALITGAGSECVGWTEEQALAWAQEGRIGSSNAK
jgi:hypothetical protein